MLGKIENKEMIDVADLPKPLHFSVNTRKPSKDEILHLEILEKKRRPPSHELFTPYRRIASHFREKGSLEFILKSFVLKVWSKW